MSDLYSVDPVTQPVDLYKDAEKTPAPTKEVLDQRSFKYSVATGMPIEDVRSLLLSGREDELRTSAVSKNTALKIEAAKAATGDYIANGGTNVETARALAQVVPESKDTILEKEFAGKITDLIFGTTTNDALTQEMDQNPEGFAFYQQHLIDSIAKQEYFGKLLEETQQKYDALSWGHWGGQVINLAIPFFTWANMSNEVEGGKSLLPWSNLTEQIDRIRTLPLDEARVEARKLIDNVAKDNPVQALEVAHALVNYSENQKVFGNFMEVASIPGWGLAAKLGKTAVSSVGKTLLKSSVKVPEALSGAGKILDAAEVSIKSAAKPTTSSALADVSEGLASSEIKRLEEMTSETTLFNDVSKNVKDATAETMYKSPKRNLSISEFMVAQKEKALKIFRTPVSNESIDRRVAEIAFEAIRNDFKARFNSFADGLIGARYFHGGDSISGISTAEAILGKTPQMVAAEKAAGRPLASTEEMPWSSLFGSEGATPRMGARVELDYGSGLKDNLLFDTPEQADFTARNLYHLGEKEFIVNPAGDGYVITVAKDLDETTQKLIDTKTADDLFKTSNNRLVDIIRALSGQPGNILPENIIKERRTAVSSSALTLDMLGDLASPLKELKRSELRDLKDILTSNMNELTNIKDPNSRGLFYNSVSDLEDSYMTIHKRLPNEREIKGYFTAVMLHDTDYMLKNLSIARHLSRQGVENIKTHLDGVPVEFNGKLVGSLADVDSGVKVLMVDAKTGKSEIKRLSKKLRADSKDMIEKEGYRVYQTAMPLRKEVDGKNIISFVVTKDAEHAPVKFNQMPYRQGFHSKYADAWKIATPAFEKAAEKLFYTGDNLAFYVKDAYSGKKIVDALEQARLLYKTGDKAALSAHLSRTLPISADDFIKKYASKEWDAEHPFYLTETNKELFDHPEFSKKYNGVKRFTDEHKYNLEDYVDQSYRQERGKVVKGIYEDAGKGFVLTDATQVDPLLAQSQELARLAKNRFYGKLTERVADQMIDTFGHYLYDGAGNKLSLEQLRRNPTYWINNAQLKADDTLLRRQFYALRNSHRRLIGQMPEGERVANKFVWKLMAGTMERLGMRRMIPSRELPLVTNGINYMRAIAFYAHMGFFAPQQFFVQAAGTVVATSQHPLLSIPASLATVMMRRLSLTESEDVIRHAAKSYAGSKIPGGFSEDMFVESHKWMKRSGFDVIKGQHMYTDAFTEESLLTAGAVRRGLDYSTGFFREGERINNMNAWNIAYLEFAKANKNKIGKMTQADAKEIHARAATLSGMMQRDFQAGWQQSIFALPTQFYGYYARMIDLAIGGRLTWAEKAKLYTGLSVAFGSHYGAAAYKAVTTGDMTPVGEQLYGDGYRKWALKNGENLKELSVVNAIDEGVPATILGFFLADRPNFGERYGVGGYEELTMNVRRAMKEDSLISAIAKAATGASGDTVSQSVADFLPFIRKPLSHEGMSLDEAQGHLKELLTNVSTFKTGFAAIDALQTGMYYSKNSIKPTADNIPTLDAIANGITGMQPQKISDSYKIGEVLRDKTKDKQAALKAVIPMMKTMEAIARTEGYDSPRYEDLWKRVDVILRAGGYGPDETWSVKAQMFDNTSLVDDKYDQLVRSTDDLQTRINIREGQQ